MLSAFLILFFYPVFTSSEKCSASSVISKVVNKDGELIISCSSSLSGKCEAFQTYPECGEPYEYADCGTLQWINGIKRSSSDKDYNLTCCYQEVMDQSDTMSKIALPPGFTWHLEHFQDLSGQPYVTILSDIKRIYSTHYYVFQRKVRCTPKLPSKNPVASPINGSGAGAKLKQQKDIFSVINLELF